LRRVMASSTNNIEDEVRRRAYELWEQYGRPDGGEEEFWLKAEARNKGSPKISVARPRTVENRLRPARKGFTAPKRHSLRERSLIELPKKTHKPL